MLQHVPAETDHYHHHVVDFVRHAAGQLAHRLEPMRLSELLLHPLVLGDLPPIQGHAHVTGPNAIAGPHPDTDNRRDDAARQRGGFGCCDYAAGFPPFRRLDRGDRNNGDPERLTGLLRHYLVGSAAR